MVPRTQLAYTLVALMVAVVLTAQPSSAQDIRINWTPTTNLSDTLTSSTRPTASADLAGNVHVVWGETMGGEAIRNIPGSGLGSANTLVYTCWNGSAWSHPVDIIAVPGDPLADYAALAADSSGYLHLVWTGLTTIYYSRALASEAMSPHAWSVPVIIDSSARTSWESAVAVDAQGSVHIVYADGETDRAVMYLRIADHGLGRRASARLSAPLVQPDEAAFYNVSLKIDPRGRLHALWGTVRDGGFGHAIYYARSVDGGQTWGEPLRLAQGEKGIANAQVPSLGIAGDSELHLIYAYPANQARTERISPDAGETWGEAHTIYEDMEGIAGFAAQLTDAAGNLHVVANMRTHEQAHGLYYWRWLGDHWSERQVASLETKAMRIDGHFVAATMRLGNEIQAVWNSQLAALPGEVWHVSGVVPDVAALAPVALPTVEAGGHPSAQPAPSSDAPVAQVHPTITDPVEHVSEGMNRVSAQEPPRSPDMASTLLASLVPALLLVLGTVVWRLARNR